MAGWMILGLFLALLLTALALLVLPWYIQVNYTTGQEPQIYLQWLLFRVRLAPSRLLKKKDKKKSSKENRPKAKRKKGAGAEVTQKKKITPEQVLDMARLALEGMKKGQEGLRQIFCCFRLTKVRLTVVVSTGDAAKTAIAYGRLSGAVYVTAGLMKSLFTMADPEISLSADFLGEESRMNCHIVGRLIPIVAVIGALRLGIALLTVYLRQKKEVKNHEPNRKQLHSQSH